MKELVEIKVFVSCPGDVATEKAMIKDVCKSLNNSLEQTSSKFRFVVQDFKDIVAEWDGRPQNEINKRYADYDIYIGILWMRFGTPSGETDKSTGLAYQSGTEEEFRIAQARKRAGEKVNMYIFFKSPRGSTSIEESQQLIKVQTLQKEIAALGWVHTFPDELKSTVFNNQIHELLNTWVRKAEQELISEKKKKFILALNKEPTVNTIDFGFFTKNLPPFKKAIPRTLSAFDADADPMKKYFEDKVGDTLYHLVPLHQYIVVLGNAGSGKSTELTNLAHLFNQKESAFIPIFHRLNTYVEQALEDFLPIGWQQLPPSTCLLVLDGLDEVQPHHFQTAIRQILNFINKFPEVRIVVSCRTNFYEFPDQFTNGTLPEFKVFFLEDISPSNLTLYASEEFKVDGDAFFSQAHHFGFGDLIRQPFFLNLLLPKFKKSGTLDIDKTALLDNFIRERMLFDQQHFKGTKDLKSKRSKIMALLSRLALIMEYMGKNYLSYHDLCEVFPEESDLELIKYSTAFKTFEAEPGKWGFEHNNIQEFLAASALDKLGIEEIKEYISFKGNKVKPSWVNTLFFLMSIITPDRRDELIQWILSIEPEILVRIERDKVSSEIRFTIFKEIFAHYQRQDVWLRSNKFSTRDLAEFVPANEGNKHLRMIIAESINSRRAKLNAVELIKHQKLEKADLTATKTVLVELIEQTLSDQHIFFSSANAISKLDLSDKKLISRLMKTFGRRTNQYIRTGLYGLIISAKVENQFIDYLIDGLTLNEKDGDRENINLMDEEHKLKDAFDADLNIASVDKVLSLLVRSSEAKLFALRDKQDILRNVISSAAKLYTKHKGLLPLMLELFKKNARISEELMARIINHFFEMTGTNLFAFKEVFNDSTLGNFEKSLLYKLLLSNQITDYLIIEYKNHNLKNEDLLNFYDNVNWLGRNEKGMEVEYLTLQLKNHTSILNTRVKIDYQKKRQEKEQKNLELYFSIYNFQKELRGFYKVKKVSELDGSMLWEERRHDFEPDQIRDAAFDLLVDFTRGNRTAKLLEVLKFTQDTEKFENYLFAKLKEKIHGNPSLELTDQQRIMLEAWVRNRTAKSDILEAIQINENDSNRYSFDNLIMTLWYFISRFRIKVSQGKILDFTTYSEPDYNKELSIDFTVIEDIAGNIEVGKRITKNLKQGIAYPHSWRNNAVYALENNLVKTYPIIIKDLSNKNKSTYIRREVAKKYARSTRDIDGLQQVLKAVGNDSFRWDILQLATQEFDTIPQIEPFLNDILEDQDENIEEKFRASKYLTKMGNTKGTFHFLEAIILDSDILNIDNYHDGSYLRLIKDEMFIPKLIDLLVVTNQPENKQDDFDRLDNMVSEALLNIASQSEDNMLKVKEALQNFILDNTGNIENVNFYYPMIERMEYSFYLAQSQQATVQQAIAEIDKLSQT